MSTKNNSFVFRLFSVFILFALLFGTIGVTPVHAGGGPLHVKPAATGTGDCLSWANACTLQAALAIAGIYNPVWVMTGSYKPTTGTDRSATFLLTNGASVYGGFVGTETALGQRDPLAHVTILHGNIGAAGSSDNSYHVVTGATGATLDGFTITAGNADGAYPNNRGGGIYNPDGSSPTLANLIFLENSASFGGGLYNYSGSSTLTNITFIRNTATLEGGGMYNYSSNPTLTNVTFSGNTADNYGGGMYNVSSSPTLTNVTFNGNSAKVGGGMYIYLSSSAQIRNTLFWDNVSVTASSAQIYNNAGTTVVSDSVVQGGCPAGSTCANIITTDPKLGTLGDYGGFTLTIPLLAGSSAIDSGADVGCPTTDQRGVTRPQGAHCDIGAYEADAAAALVPPVVIASDGTDTTGVNVSWTASSGATSYLAYRSDSLAGVKVPPNGIATTGLGGADSSATPGVDYYYWVKACNAGVCSDFSVAEPGWRALTPPVVTASDGTFPDKVQVSWNTVSGAIGYIAYRSDSPSGVKIPPYGVSTTGLGGPDASAQTGVTYYYWVLACSQMHCSSYSAAETGWRQ